MCIPPISLVVVFLVAVVGVEGIVVLRRLYIVVFVVVFCRCRRLVQHHTSSLVWGRLIEHSPFCASSSSSSCSSDSDGASASQSLLDGWHAQESAILLAIGADSSLV
jgi:hypothetical protein